MHDNRVKVKQRHGDRKNLQVIVERNMHHIVQITV